MCLLLVSCFLFNCDSGSSSTTMTLSFYATEDPGVLDVTIYVDGDSKGTINHHSTDGFSVDCDAVEWPKAYLGVGDYFIEYYKDGARYASQNYTVTADDLGACIPLLAYP